MTVAPLHRSNVCRLIQRLGIHLLVLAGLFCLASCDGGGGGGAATVTTLHGAWLGEGTFRTSHGDAEVQAQLEILPDGTYRYLILKPAMLALVGEERGTWVRDGGELKLTPAENEPAPPKTDADGKPSVMDALRSTPRQLKPKTLTVADDLSHISMQDGKFTIRYTPNPQATQQLRDAGEL